MVIETKEINGVNCKKEKRYLDICITDGNTKIECGLFDYVERKELAEHLANVIDDLLYNLEDSE